MNLEVDIFCESSAKVFEILKMREVFSFQMYFKQLYISSKSFYDYVEITDNDIISLKIQVQFIHVGCDVNQKCQL